MTFTSRRLLSLTRQPSVFPVFSLGYQSEESLLFKGSSLLKQTRIVACKATKSNKKTSKGDNIPLILKGNDPACSFTQVNLTTSNLVLIEELKSLTKLTNEEIFSNEVTYGAGMLKYEGQEWYNGCVYLGKNANNRYVFSFSGAEGLKVLREKFLSEPRAAEILNQMTVSQVSYLMTINMSSTVTNMESWRHATAQSVMNCSTEKTSVYLEKSCFKVNKSTSQRFISLEPLTPVGKQENFEKILIRVSFKDATGMRFLTGLLDMSANVKFNGLHGKRYFKKCRFRRFFS